MSAPASGGDDDVLVLGGGLAGLTAARLLFRQGAAVRVLEARDRVGGRTLTRRVGGHAYDLGAQWLGPGQDRMYALCRELGLGLFPTFCQGTKVLDVGGKVSTYRGSIPSLSPIPLIILHRAMGRLERLCRQVPLADPLSAARAKQWDRMTVETWKRAIPSQSVRDMFDVAVRTVFGAESAELSLLYFLFYLHAGGGIRSLIEIKNGAQQDRFTDGAQGVALALAAALGDRVVLQAPIGRIEQDAHGVTVHAGGGRHRGKFAVLAIPPALAARIEYAPALPPDRDALTQRMAMGATTKVIALYDRPFWREGGLSGEVVATAGPISAVFDDSPEQGAGALLGFSVGQPARVLSAQGEAARRESVLGAFARWFGAQAREPDDYIEQDWSREIWTRGCPVGTLPPFALSQFAAALRRPVGRLHFAGTETATEWTGYMEGAVQSGERAASEVAARL